MIYNLSRSSVRSLRKNDTLRMMLPDREKKERIMIILAGVIIIALSGISPIPHPVINAVSSITRNQETQPPAELAEELVFLAARLPWQSDLWEQAGYLSYQGANFDLAISAFKNAASQAGLSSGGYLVFGDAYFAAGNPYTASQVWQAAVRIFGPSIDLLDRIAKAQRELDDPGLIDTLITLLDIQQLTSTPESEIAPVYNELGILLAIENPASSAPYLLQAVRLNPNNSTAASLASTIQQTLPHQDPAYTLMAVGREFANQDMWDLAVKAFQHTTVIQPDYAEGWAFLGESLQHLDEQIKTNPMEPLQTALKIDPTSIPGNIFMALYWKRAGDPEQQYHYLAKAARIDPDNPDILVDLGEAAANMGDLDAGYEYHLEATQLTHNDPTYLHFLVKYCIRYNYLLREVALPTARYAVNANNTNPASLDTMGQVLFRLGDILNAQRFFLRALSVDPNYSPSYFHLGLVYNLLDQPEAAADSFTLSITLAPGTETASQAQRMLDWNSFP